MQHSSSVNPTWLDLYEWRERVARMYRARAEALGAGHDPRATWESWRTAKDAHFAHHPQSPLAAEQRATFTGLRYFDYDPAFAVEADLEPVAEADDATMSASGPHTMRFRRAAVARLTLGGTAFTLNVYWIDIYGGGLFLPFRDATSGAETYGGGRYLFDTVKGSDFIRLEGPPPATGADTAAMGYAGGRVLLDFNYAYNPSCAYDARWVCPLAPNENRLPLPVRAGELAYEH
ncbi:MAG TPA: DUF1684 domain-containing protein [Ktedonobacterales bacterium]|jgi:hypothetical protein